MSDRVIRDLERRLAADPDDEDAHAALVVLLARAGDPAAQLALAVRRWLAADAPAPVDPEVQARCSDPAWGLAYDDPAWGRMCYVPAHVAVLGSDPGDTAWVDETPAMRVAVPAYWIAREPATLAQWRALGRADGRPDGTATPHGYAASVSWDDVTAALGSSAPDDAGASYRVYRGGSWYYVASGCRAANRDRAGPGGRYGDLGFRHAASGADAGASYRVYRGGSWYYVASGCRAALRDWGSPGFRYCVQGFRPAASGAEPRLPTEDEWEAAARGPLGSVYPWGAEWLQRVEDRLGPAGASWCGVRAMSGVVWQWTADAWSESRHGVAEERAP